MPFPVSLLLAALAGPGAMALALPSEAPPWLAAVEGLREKVDTFDFVTRHSFCVHPLHGQEPTLQSNVQTV